MQLPERTAEAINFVAADVQIRPNAVGGGLEPPTVRLATVQLLVVNPSRFCKRHYAAFFP
ncbi:hypothetical protein GCM10028803_22840 [Larkinella knui]